MALLRMAHVPPPVAKPDISVLEAIDLMAAARVGAVVVVADAGAMLGIFTERDVMLRVVKQGRDPGTTLVREVMTSEVKTVTDVSTADDAIDVMLIGHLRHVPIVDGGGKVLGLLSIRALLEDKVDNLSREVSSLELYMANDGPGG